MKKFLIIQTAFLGDAVLVTSIIEKLHAFFPDAAIDLVVRKGNEGLFVGGEYRRGAEARRSAELDRSCADHTHPFLRKLFVWDKRTHKTRNLFHLIGALRHERYDHIFNAQRFFSTGLMMVLARGKEKVGYNKNPLSFLFSRKVKHEIPEPAALRKDPQAISTVHEVDRLNALIAHLTDASRPLPKLYPTAGDQTHGVTSPYVTIAPASVWFTKQWPEAKWIELVNLLPRELNVVLIGAPGDVPLCERIAKTTGRGQVLAGKLSLLASAALMRDARMNYVNDSAPLHIASAMNAPVTAVFCSTVPAFGFGPLNANGRVAQLNEPLYCRPCGLHGYKACPEGHFKCALGIVTTSVV